MARDWQNLGTLGIIISILLYTATAENTTYPTMNNNLNPLQAQRSARFCMWNTSTACQWHSYNYTLTQSGWLNVTNADGLKFCQPNGCGDHTRLVLGCLYHVMKDYIFENNANIKDLNDTINIGCTSQGFTGVSRYTPKTASA